MPSIKCQCSYEDFILCVPKNSKVFYCRPAHSTSFVCAYYEGGAEHIYEGHEPSTFLTDFPRAIQVKGITVG